MAVPHKIIVSNIVIKPVITTAFTGDVRSDSNLLNFSSGVSNESLSF
jgi:hypothetical protein